MHCFFDSKSCACCFSYEAVFVYDISADIVARAQALEGTLGPEATVDYCLFGEGGGGKVLA